MHIRNKRSSKKRKTFGEIVKVFDDISSDLATLQAEEDGHVDRLAREIEERQTEMVAAQDQRKKASIVAAKIDKLISVDEDEDKDAVAYDTAEKE